MSRASFCSEAYSLTDVLKSMIAVLRQIIDFACQVRFLPHMPLIMYNIYMPFALNQGT